MLDHDGLPNFKITGMICGADHARRQLLLLRENWAGAIVRFRSRGAALFFTDRVCDGKCLPACATMSRCKRWPTRCSVCCMCSGFSISSTKIVYLTPRSSTGAVTGQFYVLYLIAVTKFSDMGAYLTGSAIGRHLMIPHISAKKTWEGFFGALAFSLVCEPAFSN